MTDEMPALRMGMTLAEMDEHFNLRRKEAAEREQAERLAWLDREQERAQARGVELKKQFHRHILDHMPMPEHTS